tara:strand:+ start:990 stop:2105 length:1116 start_codon:yes stop_codon:yes gene_type:complete
MRASTALGLLSLASCLRVTASKPIPPHSVSGFSAGASMAINHLVAFSDVVEGMGIIGGSPYGCNTVPDNGASCSGFQAHPPAHLENTSIPWTRWVRSIRSGYLAERAAQGRVPPLANLVDKPVWLFSGLDDVWVYQSVMRAVAMQFANFSSRVKTVFSYYAAHSWVVDDETCKDPGAQRPLNDCCGFKNGSTRCPLPPKNAPLSALGCCGVCASGDNDERKNVTFTDGWRPPINSCNFDMSGEVLRWILGPANVSARKPVVASNLIPVQQQRWLPADWTVKRALLDDTGFVYVPRACAVDADDAARGHLYASRCRIHVHYHPCGGSWRPLSLSYMLGNALPAYAEGNDLVILYPQSAAGSENPAGGGVSRA